MTVEKLYEGSLVVEPVNKVFEFEGRAPIGFYSPTIDWQAIADHYKIEGNPDWQEKICTILDMNQIKTGSIEVGWLTSYDLLAIRSSNILEQPTNLAVVCILVSADNKILIGKRGGEITPETVQKYARGYWGTLPAGQATWSDSYDYGVIYDTAINEASEELGISFKQITKVTSLGMFSVEADELLPGIKFAVCLNVDLTAAEIKHLHKNSGAPDAYEHSELMSFDNDKEGVIKIMTSHKMTGAGRGALMLHSSTL